MVSLFEGHPKALIEAMSCGLPVIGSNVPGIQDIIGHKKNGYLCETSVESIQSAIQFVLSNDTLKTNIAKNARQFVEDNYALPIIYDRENEIMMDTVKNYQQKGTNVLDGRKTSVLFWRAFVFPPLIVFAFIRRLINFLAYKVFADS